MQNKFSERFRELLAVRNLTQANFARKLGLKFNTVNNWYTGRYEPNFDTLILICKELGESSDWLLGITD